MPENPFLSFLEDQPEAGFFSFQNQFGKTPNMKRFFQNQFSNIQNQYLGQLGQWVRAGSQGTPQGFTNFLEQFPWQQQFQEGTLGQRSEERGRFSPFTRFIG